jgi:CelD/BcsL family acetyltransferase involved in cellulose biosynthesis
LGRCSGATAACISGLPNMSRRCPGSDGSLDQERCRPVQGLDLQVIRSSEGLAALAEEWNSLAARCPGYFLSQTFQWAETAWETIARPLGRELTCMALRSEGRLVAVWPLVICRDRGLRTIRPLCSEVREYCAPLVEPGDEAESRIAFLWRSAARFADLAILSRVHTDSLLARVLKNGGPWSVSYGSIPAPYVARADYPDWAAYHATISSQLRYQIRRRRKKLAEKGEVVLERESMAGRAALIDWMLDHKKRWLVRSNLTNDWMHRADCRDFLVALAMRSDATGCVTLFVLKVDGVPIAAYLVSVDRSRVEYHVSAYDADWSPYSPGAILIEHLLHWAFDQGLDFDFRNGDQAYKFKWAKRSCDTAHWHVATSKRGIPAVAFVRARLFANQARQTLALGRLLPGDWRHRLKTLLTRRTDSSTPT